MKDVLILIAIALVIGFFIFLLEYWMISVPIIAAIVVLFIFLNHRSKMKEDREKKSKLNDPKVMSVLNREKKRILFFFYWFYDYDPVCSVFDRRSNDKYNYDYEFTKQRKIVYLWMTLDNNSSWRESNENLKQLLCGTKEAREYTLRNAYGQYYCDEEWYNLTSWINYTRDVIYDGDKAIISYGLPIDLDDQVARDVVYEELQEYAKTLHRLDCWSKIQDELQRLYADQPNTKNIAVSQNKEVSAATSPASSAVSTHKPEPQKPVAPKNINAFLDRIQLPTNREITIGTKNCDLNGGYADRHAKIKKIGDDWYISNLSLECRASEKITLKINGKEVGHSYTKLNSGDMITLVGIFHTTNYKFTIQ